MSLEYTFLSKEIELQGTVLRVCDDEKCNLSVLQYMEMGKLLYSHQRGMYSENNKKQIEQIKSYLQLANNNNVDLVISPEASVPIEVIHEIINGNLRPEKGKLWCLGAEGIDKESYKQLIDECDKNSNLFFKCSKIKDLCKYVNAAFYFFITEKGKLAVILQAKTGAMRDISFEHEQADLSFGGEIYIIDLNGEKEAHNVLATLICADILNVNPTEFSMRFHGKSPIILNIQMNAKPFFGKIIEFRKVFFSDNEINAKQMIVANWGRGSTIREETASSTLPEHEDSGSAIYVSIDSNHGNNNSERLLQNSDFVVNGIGKAQKQGMDYFLSRHYEIWKLQENIKIANYEIRKGHSNRYGYDPTLRQYFPFVFHKYEYDSKNSLVETNALTCDCSEMKDILFNAKERASIEIKECASQNCEECVRFYVDELIRLCLGEKSINEEFFIEGEGKSQRTVQALYQGSMAKNKKKKFRNLIDGMEKVKFPERFGIFNEHRDFYFKIDRDAAERGGNNLYNLEVKCGKQINRILVVYLGECDEADVKARYTDIKNRINEERRENVLLYYLDSNGIQMYKEPYEQESIFPHNNNFSRDIETII